MSLTIEGIYKDGRIELTKPPNGIGESRVLVTFITDRHSPGNQLRYGQFAGPRMSTEEDFHSAEWRGMPKDDQNA